MASKREKPRMVRTIIMEEQYKNREIDEKFNNLSVLVREKHDDVMIKINEVIVQTTKTNGSVANLKLWRAYLTGGLAVVTFLLVSIIIPLLSSYIQNGNHI